MRGGCRKMGGEPGFRVERAEVGAWKLMLRAGGWLKAEVQGLRAEVEGGRLPLRDSRRRRDLIRPRLAT